MNETDQIPPEFTPIPESQPWYKPWLRYLPYILFIVFFFLWVNSCNGVSSLEKKTIEDAKELALLKNQFKTDLHKYVVYTDSLSQDSDEKQQRITFLEQQHREDSVAIEKKRVIKNRKVEKIKHYSSNDFVEFFGKRYDMVKSISSSPEGITLKDSLPNAIATDLVNYDFTREELQIKNKTIGDYKTQLDEAQLIIQNDSLQIKEGNNILQKAVDVNLSQDKVLKDTEKSLHRAQLKNKLLNVGIPAALITGVIGGILIAK